MVNFCHWHRATLLDTIREVNEKYFASVGIKVEALVKTILSLKRDNCVLLPWAFHTMRSALVFLRRPGLLRHYPVMWPVPESLTPSLSHFSSATGLGFQKWTVVMKRYKTLGLVLVLWTPTGFFVNIQFLTCCVTSYAPTSPSALPCMWECSLQNKEIQTPINFCS